uniref:Protein kinase domain-containing protein n=1 Tax=Panagrolaimus davidi TaxID=227884 RepID=A0A914QZ25_9BILA
MEVEGAGIFRQLCEAVYCLHHTLGVVHTYENNDIKLADFGFARHISQAQTSTSFYGTKPYSAPQLVQQKPYNSYAADCYASGVVTIRPASIALSSGFASLGSQNVNSALTKVVEHLRKELHQKETKIRDLQEYLDKLLSRVIETHPEVLQVNNRHY